MARIKLDIPTTFHFTTELPIRISDVNYGGHLGNDSVLSLIHEARVRFLMDKGYTEFDVEGAGIIMSDAAIVFKSEAFYGEAIRIQIAVKDFSKFGCDMYYVLRERESGREIAQAKTGIVFFNYQERKLLPVPEKFQKLFFDDF
jgi:acyl-CoA thioesterase FadM